VLGHVPLGDILLAAEVTDERPHSCMLTEMHLQVRSGIIFFVTALKLTMEFVYILMCFFMVPEDPFLSEL
jgi:hypothetical protein